MLEKYRTAVLALSIFTVALPAHGQTLPRPSADASVLSSDVRGRPGEFFNRHSISQWRADYVLAHARPAPASGFTCADVAYVAFAKVLKTKNFLFQSLPTTGSDYDQRVDRIQTYRIPHDDPAATYVFGCWKTLSDFGDFDRASSIWTIPGDTRLRVCEVTLGRSGRAICY